MTTVFFADRDEEYRIRVTAGLRAAGSRVVEFTSGSQLLARVLQEEPDLVVTDTDLEQLDGFQVFVRLQQERAGNPFPLVFLTRFNHPGVAHFCRQQGALDYLGKEQPLEEVLERIQSVLAGADPLYKSELPAALASLESDGKSGLLDVTACGEDGYVLLYRGTVVEARWNHFEGDEALKVLTELPLGARFRFAEWVDELAITQTVDLGRVLEVMRRDLAPLALPPGAPPSDDEGIFVLEEQHAERASEEPPEERPAFSATAGLEAAPVAADGFPQLWPPTASAPSNGASPPTADSNGAPPPAAASDGALSPLLPDERPSPRSVGPPTFFRKPGREVIRRSLQILVVLIGVLTAGLAGATLFPGYVPGGLADILTGGKEESKDRDGDGVGDRRTLARGRSPRAAAPEGARAPSAPADRGGRPSSEPTLRQERPSPGRTSPTDLAAARTARGGVEVGPAAVRREAGGNAPSSTAVEATPSRKGPDAVPPAAAARRARSRPSPAAIVPEAPVREQLQMERPVRRDPARVLQPAARLIRSSLLFEEDGLSNRTMAARRDTLVLNIKLRADGIAQRVEVARSSGDESIDRAAVAAAGKVRWEPKRTDRDGAETWITQPIAFDPPRRRRAAAAVEGATAEIPRPPPQTGSGVMGSGETSPGSKRHVSAGEPRRPADRAAVRDEDRQAESAGMIEFPAPSARNSRPVAKTVLRVRYPPELANRGIGGTAIFRVLVDEAGRVERVELLSSSGSTELDAAAMDAIRATSYHPARKNGRPVAGWTRQSVVGFCCRAAGPRP